MARTRQEPSQTKEEALQGLPAKFIHCRAWGHNWDGEIRDGATVLDALNEETSNEYWHTGEQTCGYCGYYIKSVWNHVWDLVYQLQRYPKGYLLHHTGERATRIDGKKEISRRTTKVR